MTGFIWSSPSADLISRALKRVLKYQGYLKRQEADVQRSARDENKKIPREFEYAGVPGLSSEVVQRLAETKPETIGQATRVPGVTPAAITVLSSYVSRRI